MPYIEVLRIHARSSKAPKRYFWHVRSSNGQISLVSQAYFTKWSAKRAAKKFGAVNNLAVRIEA